MGCQRRSVPCGVLLLAILMGMMNAATVLGETTIVPSITLSERYSSNILYVAGKPVDDFITTAAPAARVDHEDRFIRGNVLMGFGASVYAQNPAYNYISVNGAATLELDRVLERMVPGLSLTVADSFRYSPELPGFLEFQTGNEIPPSFAIGIQAARANSFSNRGTADSNLIISPTVGWQVSYLNQILTLETPSAQSPTVGGGYNTVFQTVNTGPHWQMTPNDSLSLTYQYNQSKFVQGGAVSRSTGFETNGGLIGWTRILSPELTASVSVGATLFATGEMEPLYNASLTWKSGQDDAVTLVYSRSVMPSFYIGATALMSNVARISATHQFTHQITGSVFGNYAINESVPAGFLKFEGYSYGPNVNYSLGDGMSVSLTYTHSWYATEFSSTTSTFTVDQAILSFRGEWR